MFRCERPAWRRSALVAVGVVALTAGEQVIAAPWSSLGAPLTPREISSWDIDLRPDGKGLPKGQGSVTDGQMLYDTHCASCHGVFGESNDYIALTGGIGTLASEAPQRTVASKLDYATTLWDYINRAMPFTHSKQLTVDEVYAVTAYVLNLAEVLPMDAVLDQTSLPKVEMPNRGGFTQDHGFMRVDGTPDVKEAACMQDCATEVTVRSTLPEGFTQEMYGDVRTHFRPLAGLTDGVPEPAVAPATIAPQTLASNAGCLVCHGVDVAKVGPAFTAIAARYAGKPAAWAELVKKVRHGGSGNWGSAMMPAQTGPSDDELAALVSFILNSARRP